jgi:glycosyltransferase involved in cell wall biosynthesis
LLVSPSDPAALADAICQMLSEPEQARRLAQAGRALMLERYGIDRTTAAIAAMYEELMRTKEPDRCTAPAAGVAR